MHVVVTGALGFVGANVSAALLAAGHSVTAIHRGPLDLLIAGELQAKAPGAVQFQQGDVRDQAFMERILAGSAAHAIIHAAAITPSVEKERAQPEVIFETNEASTLSLLLLAYRFGLQRFLFLSSAAVYAGSDSHDPLDEHAPLRTDGGLYALTKLASERLCRWATARYGLDTRIVRIGPVYGPFERPTASRENMTAVYRALNAALRGEILRCNNPAFVQDWIYGADTGRALSLLVESTDLRHDTYNLAGEPISMDRLLEGVVASLPSTRIEWVATAAEANVPVAGPAQRGPLDTQRLQQDTGYQPAFTIESGIAAYHEWLTRSDAHR